MGNLSPSSARDRREGETDCSGRQTHKMTEMDEREKKKHRQRQTGRFEVRQTEGQGQTDRNRLRQGQGEGYKDGETGKKHSG